MRLDLDALLTGDLLRLRYVRRFSIVRVNHPESVAEHSYYTALFALMVAWWCRWERGMRIDMEKLMLRVLMHDTEEGLTGDIVHPFKHSDGELNAAIARAACKAFKRLWHRIADPVTADALEVAWRDAKDRTTEGRIVAFADHLSVVSYLVSEKAAGNDSLMDHARGTVAYCRSFLDESYAFLHPLVDEVLEILERYGIQD